MRLKGFFGKKGKKIFILRIGDGGCWLDAELNRKTYINVSDNGKRTLLHRLICERVYGQLGNLVARHKCDNKACVNPDHIEPGSHQDNMRDAVKRQKLNRGSKNGQAKLTEEVVRSIRNRHIKRSKSYRALAEEYGVCESTILGIVSRRLWRHI